MLPSNTRFRSILPRRPSCRHDTPQCACFEEELPTSAPRRYRHFNGNKTPIACQECRRKKAKCNAERPKCKLCVYSQTECNYRLVARRPKPSQDVEDESRAQLQPRNLYEELYHHLQKISEKEAQEVLRRIRNGDDVATTVRHIVEGNLFSRVIGI